MVNFYGYLGEYESNQAALVPICAHWYAGFYHTNIYNRDKICNGRRPFLETDSIQSAILYHIDYEQC
jgi:hypothetical protein